MQVDAFGLVPGDRHVRRDSTSVIDLPSAELGSPITEELRSQSIRGREREADRVPVHAHNGIEPVGGGAGITRDG